MRFFNASADAVAGDFAQELLELSRAAAAAGGEAALASLTSGGLEVETKTTGLDVVTNADRASQDAILALITQARPEDGFVGEEGGNRPSASGVTWVVDPIDSTANLVRGIPIWSVSVAAKVDGWGIAGCVSSPALGESFSGAVGLGVWVDHARAELPPEPPTLATSLGLVGWTSGNEAEHRGSLLTRLIADSGRLRSPGSPALGLAWIAAGRADFGYYEQPFHDWDVEAGLILCQEAGLSWRVDLPSSGPNKLLVARPNLMPGLDWLLPECD